MTSRRRSRELALQLLFQGEFSGPTWDMQNAFNVFCENFETPTDIKEFAWTLTEGIWTHKKELDQIISAHSPHWNLTRMAFVDRNILRMACYELKYLHDQVPPKVVIDEGIEIAKRFGSEESSAFVNGVLDNIAKSLPQLRDGLAG